MALENINVLRSFLITEKASSLIRNNGEEVPADELEGKIVGIYFLSRSIPISQEFTRKLKTIYEELKDQGESFEIVSAIFHERDQESFRQSTEDLPWLALPFQDERGYNLAEHFQFGSFPMLAILGENGETIRSNVSDLIDDHGVHAYPFSPEKLSEFDALEKARLDSQTLESLLVDGEHDFVISKDGIKVAVSELVGKTILFYFSSSQCPPCQRFKPKLLESYNDIKARDAAFDVIFISSDKDEAAFDESYSTMPWLALPFGDQRSKSLRRKLKVPYIPSLVAVGPNGRTVAYKAEDLLMAFGPDAYPFDEERVKEIVGRWPKILNHELHQEHELKLSPKNVYSCDACTEESCGWSFNCEACNFDLDPKCALGRDNVRGDDDMKSEDDGADGWICSGQVCYKA